MNDNNNVILANINNNTSANKEGTIMTNMNTVVNNEHLFNWESLRIQIPCVSIGAYDTFRNVVRVPDRCRDVIELFGVDPMWFDGRIRASIVSDPSHYCGRNAAVVFTSLDDEVRFMADVTGVDGFTPDMERVGSALRRFDLYVSDRSLDDVMSDWNAYNADCINDGDVSRWDASCNKYDALHHREISLDGAVMSFRLSGMWLMFDWAIKCLGGAEAVLDGARLAASEDLFARQKALWEAVERESESSRRDRFMRDSYPQATEYPVSYYIYRSLQDEYSKNNVNIFDIDTFLRFMSAQRDVINADCLGVFRTYDVVERLVSKYNELA